MRNLLGSAAGHQAGGCGQLTTRRKKRACAMRRPFFLNSIEPLTPPASPAASGTAAALGWTARAASPPRGRRCCRVASRGGTAIGKGEGNRIGNLFADLRAAFLADDQLEQDASFELLYGIDNFAACARGSSPFGMDSSGRWDLDLKVGVADSAFPGY